MRGRVSAPYCSRGRIRGRHVKIVLEGGDVDPERLDSSRAVSSDFGRQSQCVDELNVVHQRLEVQADVGAGKADGAPDKEKEKQVRPGSNYICDRADDAKEYFPHHLVDKRELVLFLKYKCSTSIFLT